MTSRKKPFSSETYKKKKKKTSKSRDDEYMGEYEVEAVVDHNVRNGRITDYFVKWRDYPAEENTWETLRNMKGSLGAIADYFQKITYGNSNGSTYKSMMGFIKKEIIGTIPPEEINLVCRHHFSEDGDTLEPPTKEDLDMLLFNFVRIPPNARDAEMVEEVRTAVMYDHIASLRQEQLALLQGWESDMNSIDKALIKVFNNVDLEGPPSNFYYILQSVCYSVEIPKDSIIGCECTSASNCLNAKCCSDLGGSRSYKDGIIIAPAQTAIYECNDRCKCDQSCGNRVLQKGRVFPVAIFRTSNGCGWGLQTLVDIPKGAFVVEYVGEIIDSEEAERRGRLYDRIGCTYLFDLDFNTKTDCPYTIDAGNCGNAAHFINHSCSPNLRVYSVWVNCLDPDIPRLGLYAKRNIKANEELTFDYSSAAAANHSNPQRLNSKLKVIPECKCGSRSCRKYLF